MSKPTNPNDGAPFDFEAWLASGKPARKSKGIFSRESRPWVLAVRPPFSMHGPEVIEHNGRFFINMGYPGFNLPANNRNGYATKAGALRAMIALRRSRAK